MLRRPGVDMEWLSEPGSPLPPSTAPRHARTAATQKVTTAASRVPLRVVEAEPRRSWRGRTQMPQRSGLSTKRIRAAPNVRANSEPTASPNSVGTLTLTCVECPRRVRPAGSADSSISDSPIRPRCQTRRTTRVDAPGARAISASASSHVTAFPDASRNEKGSSGSSPRRPRSSPWMIFENRPVAPSRRWSRPEIRARRPPGSSAHPRLRPRTRRTVRLLAQATSARSGPSQRAVSISCDTGFQWAWWTLYLRVREMTMRPALGHRVSRTVYPLAGLLIPDRLYLVRLVRLICPSGLRSICNRPDTCRAR